MRLLDGCHELDQKALLVRGGGRVMASDGHALDGAGVVELSELGGVVAGYEPEGADGFVEDDEGVGVGGVLEVCDEAEVAGGL